MSGSGIRLSATALVSMCYSVKLNGKMCFKSGIGNLELCPSVRFRDPNLTSGSHLAPPAVASEVSVLAQW